MNSNKRKEDITCCPSLTKKLKVKNDFFCATLNPLEISTISSTWSCDYDILPKVTLSVFRDYVWKKGECYWATAESMLNVDSFRKMLFSAWWICESTNQKTLWWSNSSCHHLISRLNNLKACCESPVFVSELCCHTLVLLFFLKHYVETKEKTGRVLYRATAKMSKKCSLPMMPLREIWVQSVRSKV